MKSHNQSHSAFFSHAFNACQNKGLTPARVAFETKGAYLVLTEKNEIQAVAAGKLLYSAESRASLPVVGDWVECVVMDETPPKAIIHSVMPRFSCIARKVAGNRLDEQPLAANIDTVFVTLGLDGNFNLKRIERYLAVAIDSRAQPVVLLNKCDLCDSHADKANIVRKTAKDIDVVELSAATGQGMDALLSYIQPGSTSAFIGSSGVGKSSLINMLIGNQTQLTQSVREGDSRGRHTTTRRQLFGLSNGAFVIDTPGMRELGLRAGIDSIDGAFTDIDELSKSCRFADCEHHHEPGCAVKQAISDNRLDADRLESWIKLRKELLHIKRKADMSSAQEEKQKWKAIHKQVRRLYKDK